MAQDLRKMFEEERKKQQPEMKRGHEDRFMVKLEKELPIGAKRKTINNFFWLKVAAAIVVLLGLGIYISSLENEIKSDPETLVVEKDDTEVQTISLGDLSPDLKKIENYYVTNINLELSGLEFDGDNKTLINGYLDKLSELNAEYALLNEELNQIGPNDQTINALIKNLQLRLQLLQKLKTKLNQLKSSKNEQESSNIM